MIVHLYDVELLSKLGSAACINALFARNFLKNGISKHLFEKMKFLRTDSAKSMLSEYWQVVCRHK